jgi:phosphoadenosine phosphosulfate reductase
MATHIKKNVFLETADQLKKLAETHDEILVSFSGGKDSLVVADLCCKTFKRVVGFFMYLVPGIEVAEKQVREAAARWGMPVLYYPHWIGYRYLREGFFCPNWFKIADDIPDAKLYDIYDWVMQDTGISLIAMGAKRADSLWRSRNLALVKKGRFAEAVVSPLENWNKFDVLAYLKANNIPRPDSSTGNATGIGLGAESVIWLYENYPEDYQRLKFYFPFIEAMIKRKEWFGVS